MLTREEIIECYMINEKQTIAEWLEKNNSDYVPLWKIQYEYKYYIYKDEDLKKYFVDSDIFHRSIGINYMSEETAFKLVDLLNNGEVVE